MSPIRLTIAPAAGQPHLRVMRQVHVPTRFLRRIPARLGLGSSPLMLVAAVAACSTPGGNTWTGVVTTMAQRLCVSGPTPDSGDCFTAEAAQLRVVYLGECLSVAHHGGQVVSVVRARTSAWCRKTPSNPITEFPSDDPRTPTLINSTGHGARTFRIKKTPPSAFGVAFTCVGGGLATATIGSEWITIPCTGGVYFDQLLTAHAPILRVQAGDRQQWRVRVNAV